MWQPERQHQREALTSGASGLHRGKAVALPLGRASTILEMKQGVSLALLLKERDAVPVPAPLKTALSRLGIEITSVGATSLSARVSEEDFESAFGVKAERVAARLPGRFDKGAPPGYLYDGVIDIPPEIARWIQSIDVIPPATRLT